MTSWLWFGYCFLHVRSHPQRTNSQLAIWYMNIPECEVMNVHSPILPFDVPGGRLQQDASARLWQVLHSLPNFNPLNTAPPENDIVQTGMQPTIRAMGLCILPSNRRQFGNPAALGSVGHSLHTYFRYAAVSTRHERESNILSLSNLMAHWATG
jgi:hypothetical protein